MNEPVPPSFQRLAVLQIATGACNLVFGWSIAWMMWFFAGTVCVSAASCGSCPIGGACSLVAFAVPFVGIAELVFGILMLTAPQQVRGLVGWMPLLQLPLFVLGDLISPVMAIAQFALARDPEVIAFIEGM